MFVLEGVERRARATAEGAVSAAAATGDNLPEEFALVPHSLQDKVSTDWALEGDYWPIITLSGARPLFTKTFVRRTLALC